MLFVGIIIGIIIGLICGVIIVLLDIKKAFDDIWGW